ncbi:hypothetical protein Bbelb_389640 [Branchiostoma belcheri]|nr:hypothetical protein Bbelb_389640 [Branchiostoma belcheri]
MPDVVFLATFLSVQECPPLVIIAERNTVSTMPRTKSKSVEQRRKQSATCMKRKIAESTPEAAETRRDWKRAKMQEYRSNETPGATAIRLAAKRTHMRQKRKEETPQDTEKRLAAKRTHMKQKRKEETPQDTEKRLAAKRTHMKQKRKEEMPLDTEKRLAAKRTHMKQKRKEETPQDTEKRLAAVRTHMMKRKKEETPQATEQRLVAKRTHMQKRRKEETPQATEQRLAAKRTHMQKRRKEETPQATEKRLAAKRIHMQQKRTQETQQIREKRLKAQRTHKQKRRETETPQETNRRLAAKGNVPTQSWANDMALDAIPEELKDLRPLEVRLISQRIAFMKMVGLPRGGQKAIQGSAVNQGRGENTVTIGLMGELHYVALEKADTESTQETRQEMEDEEDRIAFEQTSKVQGVPYDTLLQHEQVIDDSDRTYSVAPGENQQPCPFFSDKHFEVLANPEKYPFGKGGFSEERSKHITPRKFFNQRLLHVDGRFAKDIDYLFAAQYAVEAKQMRDSIQIFLRQTRGHTFQGQTVNAGLMKNLNNINDMLRTDTAIKEVSAQEAAFRVLSMPLKKASRQVVFVNSAAKEKRVSILKPKNILQDMTDEDTNIFCTSLIDRYVSRPLVLEDMCLVEFAATYTVAKKSRSEENDTDVPYEEENCGEDGITGSEYGSIPDRYPDVIRLCNGLGNMRKRRRHCIVRFHKEKKDDGERYRNLLMLYLPWRNEDVDLKGAFNCFKDHYESAKDIVHVNESKFSINAVRIEEACDDLQRMGPMDDMWNDVSPNVQFLQSEQLNEGVVQERDLPVEDGCENIDLAANEMSNNHSELHARYTSELNKGLMTPEEYRCMMRSLNKKQFEVVMYHRRWCKDVISALKQKQNIPQYMLFLSGPGGVGKSHVIKLIRYLTMSLLIPHSGQYFQPNELPLLLTAFTGTAAFGIQGMTLHSALGFACGPRKDNEYLPPSCEKLQALRSHLGKLKLLVIDEVSMVGADLLYHIHRRLQDISDQSTPESIFGGVSILAVGDLFQLQPVGQSHVFGLPSDSYARLYGSLWQENFEMMELTENMRQRDDQDFAALLQRVRTGDFTTQDMDLLRTRVIHKDDTNYPVNALHIFKTNKDVDEHNEQQLLTLGAQVYNIRAIDRKKDLGTGLVDIVFSSKPSDTGGLRELVSVAVGARVMVTLNIDVSDGLSNGVFGTVAGIDNAGKDVRTIMVRFDNENVGRQAVANSQFKRSFPGVVPITRQTVHFYTGRGRRSVQAERSQFPLSLAWGCTIHKVQGKTLDKVVMGMQGRGRFMPGQAYVGLSRVKTLSSLYLLGFDPNAIRVNPAVKDEMTRLRQNPESRQQMTNLNRDCSAAENSYLPLAQPSATTAHCTSLNIKFLNIRSYTQHLPDLKADSTLQPADVFCYVETFLYPNQEVELFPPNSIAVRADRKGRGGGVMTVASKNISPKQLHIQLDELEYTAITVTKLSTNVNIINIYRPQTMPEGLFISMLHRLIDQLPHDTMTVILGDFNFNILDCPQPKILAVMQQYGFTQEVQTPTTDYGTLLDHVYIRDQEQHGRHVTVMDTYFSDHDLVTVTITP